MTIQYTKKEIEETLSKFPISQDNQGATQQLLEIFPEFKNSNFYGQTDCALPYLVFADFCRFLLDRIDKNQTQSLDPLLEKVGKFITDLYQSRSKDLKDLVRVGIFEELGDAPKAVILASFLPIEIATDFKSFFN